MLGLQWLQHTGVFNRSCSSEFQAIYGSIEGAKCISEAAVLAVGRGVPTHFVLGSSACREKTAPILCFSLHDLLRGWLLPFLHLCSVNVGDCLRVDMGCVSQLEPGSAAAPSQAFPRAGSEKLCRLSWAAPRQLSRFHFSSLSSSALTSSNEAFCAQCLFPSCI